VIAANVLPGSWHNVLTLRAVKIADDIAFQASDKSGDLKGIIALKNLVKVSLKPGMPRSLITRINPACVIQCLRELQKYIPEVSWLCYN